MTDSSDLTTVLLQVVSSVQSGAYLVALSLLVAAFTLVWNNPSLLDRFSSTWGKWLRNEEAKVPPSLGQWIILGLGAISTLTQALASHVAWRTAIANAVIAIILGMFGIQKVVALGVNKPDQASAITKATGVVLLVGGMCAGSSSCASLIPGFCQYSQQLAQAEIYTDDVYQEIADQQTEIAALQGLSADELAKIQKLLGDAKMIADATRQTEMTLNTLCQKPDLTALFNGLVAIFDALEPLIAKSQKAATASGSARVPALTVHVPMIVTYLKKGGK